MKYGMLLLFVVVLSGCKVEPQPIRYGEDQCHYCWMTIVDRGHAAEVVTSKGKAFKFDAIECMLNFMRSGEEDDISLYLVNGLFSDGELLDAQDAVYLHCEQLPSPMGAFLSAFEHESAADSVRRELGGALYDWTYMKDSFELPE